MLPHLKFIWVMKIARKGGRSIPGLANDAQFARPALSGGLHTVKSMRSIVENAESVGAIVVEHSGMIGTGFCVGTLERMYVMTCRHVYEPFKADLNAGKMKISFADSLIGSAPAFALGRCVAEDEKLDYAILELHGANKMVKPITCCSSDFQTLCDGDDATDLYLTIVGYCNDLRTVDVALDWHMPEKTDIDLVKYKAAELLMAYCLSFSEKLRDPENRQSYLETAKQKITKAVGEYDAIVNLVKDFLFYNVIQHKSGSSGSPVFVFNREKGIKLVALHDRGFPDFYYNEDTKNFAQKVIPVEFTIEAGVRLSAIYEDLCLKNDELCQHTFSNEVSPMDETA